MKVHVAIGEYEFIEVDAETATEARQTYDGIKSAFKKIEGCDQKTWNKILDKYLNGEGISESDHAVLGKVQQWMLHELDKSSARLANYKVELE